METATYINGKENGVITAENRALAYGDGFFETIRITNGQLVLEDLHWRRLQHAATRLNFDVEINDVQLHAYSVIKNHAVMNGVMKIIVSRCGGNRGYDPSGSDPFLMIRLFPLPKYPQNYWNKGIELFQCETRLGYQPRLAGIKHINRLEQVLASQEWSASGRYAEGLMRDYQENIIECTKTNIFLVHKNRLLTPRLDSCGVDGVMRQWISLLSSLSCEIKETTVTMEMLKNASEVFVCNSVIGVWPVIGYQAFSWKPGQITRLIQKETERLFNGKKKC